MRETIERKQREDAEDAAFLSLTPKERQIAELIKETDYTYDEICREVKIIRVTLRGHRKEMRRKFSTGI
jgi:DNA-binding CsgD family transcriptional regulator